MPQPSAGVVIVGGGIAGLAAAYELVRRTPDLDVTIVEAADRPGGLLGSERKDGYLLESAANAFLEGTSGTAVDLCLALGVEVVPAEPTAKRRWVYRKGHLRQVPTSPAALLATDLLSVGARLRLLLEPFVPARAHGTGADETVAQFGRRRLGVEITEAVLDPFLVGVYAGDAEKLSLAAALPSLAALEAEHGSLFRGVLARRRDGGGSSAPTLVAPRAGVGALVRALADALGPRLMTSARAVALERTDGQKLVRLEGGRELAASHVVLAIPPRAAAVLVADQDERLAARLRACPAVGTMVVHVGLAPTDVNHPLDGFGFLVARDEDLRCLGCVFESSIWPERAPEGRTLLRLIYGGARDPAALTLDAAEVARVVEQDLERALGLRRRAEPLAIIRWPNAIPQYDVGHREWVAEVERGATDLGLLLGGNGYHGVSVNDCVKDARRIAAAILG